MDEIFKLLEDHLQSKNDNEGLIKLDWVKGLVYEKLKKHADTVDNILSILNKCNKTETQNGLESHTP